MTNTQAPSALPKAEGESDNLRRRRRRLIWIGVAALLLTLIVGVVYKTRIQHNDFQTLQREVITALKNKDEKKLISLASREFSIGNPESGAGAVIEPQRVMSKLIQLAGDTKWAPPAEEVENTRLVSSDKSGVALIFTHPDGYWIWSGVTSTSSENLAYLASDSTVNLEPKIEYKEIPTEEATGSEPTE